MRHFRSPCTSAGLIQSLDLSFCQASPNISPSAFYEGVILLGTTAQHSHRAQGQIIMITLHKQHIAALALPKSKELTVFCGPHFEGGRRKSSKRNICYKAASSKDIKQTSSATTMTQKRTKKTQRPREINNSFQSRVRYTLLERVVNMTPPLCSTPLASRSLLLRDFTQNHCVIARVSFSPQTHMKLLFIYLF